MFGILINIFEQALFLFFLYSLNTEHREKTIIYTLLSFIISFLLISYINQFSLSQSLLTIIFDIIYWVYLRLTSNDSRGQALMFCLIPLSVTAVINSVVDMSVMLLIFPGKSIFDILAKYQMPFDILIQASHAIAFYFIAKFIRRHELSMPEKDWFISAALIGLCNIMAVCFETVYLEYESWQYYLLLGVYCVLLFIVMILVLLKSLYSHIQQESRQKLEVEILQSQLQSNERMLQMRQELNSMRHDMKHFIALLKKENTDLSSKEIQDAVSMYESVNNTPAPVNTIMPAVNYVLNIKQEEAVQKGLNYICTLNITQPLAMEDSDLYHAIIHIGLGKTIRVNMREVRDTSMIQVCNSVNGIVINSEGYFISSAGSEGHGYGLKTIQTIADKYHGYYVCEQKGNEAVCTVFIPLEKSLNDFT